MQIMQPICTSPRTKSRQLLRSLSTEHIASAKKDHNVSLETVKMGSTSTPKSQSGRSSKRDSSSRRSKDNFVDDPENDPKNDYYTLDELVDQKIYITRQETAPFAKLFSWVQFMILVIMMIQCKVAPLNINPMIGPYPDALDYWGGKNAYKILNEGEYYRLLTPILLHAGVLHLVGNVAVQLDQGAFYEKEWGSVVWLIIYISSAIGSSILSCCFMPDNVSVGSSGAVMGLFGAKLAEVFCRACESDKSQQGKVGHFVRKEQFTESMCAVTLVMLFSFVPFVDWAAHLGGVLAGFCAGLGLCATFYGVTLAYMLNEVEPIEDLDDVCGYYQQFFEDYECNCQLEDGD